MDKSPLLTDLYQLTMAYGYWKQGMKDHQSIFNLFFRKNPFKGGYTVTAGQQLVRDFLKDLRFSDEDVFYLASLNGSDGNSLFDAGFLLYLRNLEFDVEVDAVLEGEVMFPNEPILTVKGNLIQCQLLETPLLNIMNFSSLIATKASRICRAAGDDPVLEFGLRRAQGPDGGLSASRAAYIGGCSATSNVLAGKEFGIPVKGTHAHSWIMSFETEREAFEAYVQSMPNNVILLVDTYDTLNGVRTACEVMREHPEANFAGIRLDSGDLISLSKQSRVLLDEAGFTETKIVASNDLDEYEITRLKSLGARIDIWGVGTRLATAYDQAALGGVYKLASIKSPGDKWEDKIKMSNDPIKVSNPGRQWVIRDYEKKFDTISGDYTNGVLNKPLFRSKDLSVGGYTIEGARAICRSSLNDLPDEFKDNKPTVYPVKLDRDLAEKKSRMIEEIERKKEQGCQ